MSIFLNETKHLKLYSGQFNFPINKKDKYKNSMVFLLTPNLDSSIKLINELYYNKANDNISSLNTKYFQSYFMEKSINFIINNNLHENNIIINDEEYPLTYALTESLDLDNIDTVLDELSIFSNNNNETFRSYFPDYVDLFLEDCLDEEYKSSISDADHILYQLLYKNRFKNQNEIIQLYKKIKETIPSIKYTFTEPKLYQEKNLFYDWSFYTDIFIKNNTKYFGHKGLDLFMEFINRFLSDKRFKTYNTKTILIPIEQWISPQDNILDYQDNFNAITMFLYTLRYRPEYIKTHYSNHLFVFTIKNKFFTLKPSEYNIDKDFNTLVSIIRKLITNITSDQDFVYTHKDSKETILHKVINKFEKKGIKITNLSGNVSNITNAELKDANILKNAKYTDNPDIKKTAIVDKIKKAVETSNTIEDVEEKLDNESDEEKEKLAILLMDIQQEENGPKMDKVRAARYNKTQQEIMNKTVNGKKVSELLNHFATDNPLKESAIPVDSIDEHWKHVKFPNFNETYTKEDMEADIVAMFMHFNRVTHPMNVLNIESVNTSTSEDYKKTWTVHYEDAESGKRFTMKLDLPIMIDNRFMKLRGNEKVLLGQMMLLPVVKTDEDTVQIVSNYNKIFIRTKSPSGLGKTTPIINKMCKVLNKYNEKDIKVITGYNKKICDKYELPISFVDLASQYSSFRFKDGSYIEFNMNKLMSIPFDRSVLPKEDQKLPEEMLNKKYFAVYIEKGKKKPIIEKLGIDEYILNILAEKSEKFVDLYNTAPVAKRLMFSEASVLAVKIPVIVICAYNIGLIPTLEKANIKYEISDKRPSKGQSYFKFDDAYLIYYPKNDEDNMFMNGLMQINTQEYSLKEVNAKDMWLSILDDYGGRIKADGLDNFYDLMIDPITKEICKELNIPDDYIEILIYANNLLTDNKFNKHSDITGNRIRTNEVIVGHLYQVLSKEYGAYRNMVKRNAAQAGFTAKQSAVIDSLLTHDQTSSDQSTLTPLLEAESMNKLTFKGLSGMNSDRAFNMEKRSYDKSMLGVVALSTGFANTVGINRQATIDAGVINKRGFISSKKPKDLDTLSAFSIMEAMSPMAITHDDGIRTCMAFTQTVQHQMSVRKSMPNLISTGMDEALPYVTGNKFSYKFKGTKGKVIDMTDEYIIIENLNTHEKEYVDLREIIQKNSDGGFYLTTKLTPNINIKKGSIVKYNDIIAYNKKNYSSGIGNKIKNSDPNRISYNIGTMTKIGVMNTDLGFEDSCVVDEYLSEALSTEFCVQKEVALSATSNLYSIVEKGQSIEEGDPLIIFTDSFEDEDVNQMLANITKDNNKDLSDIGRKNVHSKVSGIVQDIKIFRTVEMTKLSPSLQKLCKAYENKINKLKKVMESNKIDKTYELEPTTKLPAEGKLKNVEGILIEFYIKTVDKYSAGDKLVFYNGLKGVCGGVIPKEDAATSEYRPNETVNTFLPCTGIGARMVTSAISVGMLNKAIIELTRQCQEELGIKWRPIQEILQDFDSDY